MWAAFLASWLCWSADPAPGSGSGAAPADRAGLPTVRVVIGGPDSRVEPTRALVEDLLGDVQANLDLAVAPEIDPRVVLFPDVVQPAAARVFIDLAEDHAPVLFVIDGEYERVLARRIEVETGLDEAAREQIAQIVRASIEALLAGAVIGVTFEEAVADLRI